MKFVNRLDPAYHPGPVSEGQFESFEFDNSREPVVRDGGEPFKVAYDPEPNDAYCNLVDPSRSFAAPALALVAEAENGTRPEWTVADVLSELLLDLELEVRLPTAADLAAFRAMFPMSVARLLARSWRKWGGVLGTDIAAPLVLNDPFFHMQPNAAAGRLAEILDTGRVRYALNRTKNIPDASVVAREIALLETGKPDLAAAEATAERMRPEIAEAMATGGLRGT